MPPSDPLDVLLAHDRWATSNILDACAALTDDQFHQRFEMGPGSLHDTLAHTIAATRAWTDLLAGRELRPRLEGSTHTVAELIALHSDAADEIESLAHAHPFDEVLTRKGKDGKIYRFTRGTILTHVTTHAMHHRAQCLNMLRRLGVDPLPQSSATEWSLAQES